MDFTNPDSFHHDVNSVAGLLKQFLRELPEPLFTTAYYSDFINAARELATFNGAYGVSNEALGIDDDIQRRDSLHAIINNLPDPHYATLRALILVRIWRNQASRLSGRMRLTNEGYAAS